MNIQQAKQLSLIEVMAALGHTPHHEARADVWYLSPFRQELEPSFKINRAKNIWYDFGEGQGGNIIDFVMKLEGSNVAGALKKLAEIAGGQTSLFTRPRTVQERKETRPDNDSLKIREIKPLQNPSLTGYIGKRGISMEIARQHLQEINYEREGRPYFALAFTNDSGGYEIRNPYFKGTIGTKDIATIAGTDGQAGEILLFEGFMDFLSAKTFYQDGFIQPAIVLNSVAMKEKAVEAINRARVADVFLYLDHDESGRAVKDYFEEQLEGVVTITDKSGIYAGYKDFNEFLVARPHEPIPFSFQQ